jgi:hypothetical protein
MSADREQERTRPSANGFDRPLHVQGMTYWRWLLFAAMARLDRQDVYLRLPSVRSTTRDIVVDVGTRRAQGR